MSAREVIVVNSPKSSEPFTLHGVTVRPNEEVRGRWDGERWNMGEPMLRGPTITVQPHVAQARLGSARNLSRRELRAREEARRIVVRSDVPLTRVEREKREVSAFWQMRFDERTRAAQVVVERWKRVADLRRIAWEYLTLLRNSLDVAEVKTGYEIAETVARDLDNAELAVEEAESFILHEGADRWLGDATWAPRAELRRLQARIDW